MDHEDVKSIESLKKQKVKAEKKGNLKEEADLCNYAGEIYARYGRYDDAIKEHDRELALNEVLDNKLGVAVACRKLGECYCKKVEFDKAIHLHQRYLDLARQCNSEVEEQRALATIGKTYLEQRDLAINNNLKQESSRKAESAFLKSLEVCERLKASIDEVEYMDMRARLFFNLGLIHDDRNETELYKKYLQKAMGISEKHQLIDVLYLCQSSLGCFYLKIGNYGDAHKFMDHACGTARKGRNKQNEADAVFMKALVILQEGDFLGARHLIKKAHKIGLPTEDEVNKCQSCYRAVVKIEQATRDLKALDDGDEDRKILLYEKLGDAASELGKHTGNFKQALSFYQKMLSSCISAGKDKKQLAVVHISIIETLKDDRQWTKAISHYQKEISCWGDQDQDQVCKSWLSVAALQEQLSYDYKKVQVSYVEAYSAAKKANHRKLQVQSLRCLVELFKQNKDQKLLKKTEEQLAHICRKYKISDADLEVEEDSQVDGDEDGDTHGDEDDDEVVMSDLTESEDEEKVTATVKTSTRSGRAVRSKAIKLNAFGETPLHRACIDGSLERVKKLVAEGHPMNIRDNNGWTPLHEAANHDHYEIVSYLVDHGANMNDRGGKGCEGLTPMIDAASNGNLEIVELLMEKGANILAKDDCQRTTLDHLVAYKDAGDVVMDRVTEIKYNNLVQLLKERNPAYRGVSRNNRMDLPQLTQSALVVETAHSPVSQELPTISRRRRSEIKKPHRSRNDVIIQSDSDSGSDNDSTTSRISVMTADSMETDDIDNIYNNPRLQDLELDHSATEAYRNAITTVGRSAFRASQPSKSKSSSNGNSEAKSAFLKENEIVDDWLEDDLRPTKRRKVDVNGYFSTGNVKKMTNTSLLSPPHRKESKRKESTSQKKNLRLIDSDCDSESDLDVVVNEEEKLADVTNSLGDSYISRANIEENEEVLFEGSDFEIDFIPETQHSASGSDRTFNSYNINNASKTTSQRQLKMTDFGQRTSGSSVTSASGSSNDRLPSLGGSNSVINGNQSLGETVVTNREKLLSSVIKVKVQIQDKLLLIPVIDSEGTKTFSWLAEEASSRYFKMYGLKPTLTLGTKDGAHFSPDDLVSLMIVDNDKIEGFLQSWDMPPMAEIYRTACKSLKTVMYENMQILLQSCETTGKLNLSDLALRAAKFQPVIRALQHQTCLRELHIKGNRIGDVGINNLCKVLSTLPNLSVLGLAGNDVTGEGLKHLCTALSVSNDKPLQNVSSLDLSHNPLYDECLVQIAAIVRLLPHLSRLALSSCCLTVRCLHNRLQFTEALHKSEVQHVDVSYNNLGCTGVELFLKCQNPTKVLSLDLSATMTNHDSSQVYSHISQYVSQEGCAIQDLHLCYCKLGTKLGSDDVDFFKRLPVLARHLHKLDISGNPRLTNSILQVLLQSSATSSSNLEELVANHCGIQSPLDVDLLDSLSEKLVSDVPLRKLEFTCFKMEKIDSNSISQVWHDKWTDNAEMSCSEQFVKLNIGDR